MYLSRSVSEALRLVRFGALQLAEADDDGGTTGKSTDDLLPGSDPSVLFAPPLFQGQNWMA